MAFTPFTPDEQPTMANFNEKFQQAMAAATEAAFQVGDTLTTARRNLGSKWVLCNGSGVDSKELASLYSSPTLAIKKLSSNAAADMGIYLEDVAYYDGTWVGVGYYYNGNNNYAKIFVTKNLSGTWSQISPTYTTTFNRLYKITCYNGVWVAVGWATNNGWSGYNNAIIYTATDPFGTWTEKVLTSDGYSAASDVHCYDGTWVAVGSYSNGNTRNPLIWVTTDPAGTWTLIQPDSTNTTALSSVWCQDGIWVIAGTGVDNYPYIYTTTNPAGTWTKKQISSSYYGASPTVCCYNGIWLLFTSTDGYIYTTTDPTGTWTRRIAYNSTYNVDCVFCDGAWYMLKADNTIYKATSPTSSWTKLSYTLESATEVLGLGTDNNVVVFTGTYLSTYRNAAIWSQSYIKVPTITVDGAYVYIKVKE